MAILLYLSTPELLLRQNSYSCLRNVDNTDKNPFNPNHPPKVVTQGEGVRSMQTTEKKCFSLFFHIYLINRAMKI